MRTPWLTSLLGVLTALAVGPGCANPKCWTHDASEVSGGCSIGSGGSGGSGGSVRGTARRIERKRKKAEKQLKEHSPPCQQGKGESCALVAEALSDLHRPASDIEAHFTLACFADATVPRSAAGWCGRAGDLALKQGGAGLAAAVARHSRGCSLGDVAQCRSAGKNAFEPEGPGVEVAMANYKQGCLLADGWSCVEIGHLDPEHALELYAKGCELEATTGCEEVAKIYADPDSAHFDPGRAREHMVLGCRKLIDNLCAMLGELEVARP